MLLGHGDDGFRYGRPLRADFSSNVVADPVRLARLKQHLAARLDAIAHYPEPAAESLAEALAHAEGISPEEVLVTNGACAAIHLVAQAFRGSLSCVLTPSFSEYEDACRIHGHELQFVPSAEATAGALPRCDLLWRCNPNNPTGEVEAGAALLEQADRRPDCLHILDAAYEDACSEPRLPSAEVVRRGNVLLIRSLTKRFSIPGLRLGCLIGPAQLVARVRASLAPWTVNALAIEAGKFLLSESAQDKQAATRRLLGARGLAAALTGLDGCRVHPSATHYFLLQWSRPCAAALKTWLIERHGLLVRDASNFRGLDGRFIRVASQGTEQDAWLLEGLEEWSAGQ